MSMGASLAFYCVADSGYFVGAVGMLNSLRLLGHEEPVFILDCGLTEAQREQLAPHATVVPGPGDVPPCLLKTIAPLREAADVMVLVDADIIVTRSLAELVDRASAGRVLAIKDGEDRYFADWGRLLGMGVPRRQAYVSSSFVILGGAPGRRVLELMHELQDRIDIEGSPFAARVPDHGFFRGDYAPTAATHPFFYPEQDVLNAVLAAEIDPGQVEVLDRRLGADPPFAGLRVLDETTLRCAYDDGTQPYVLHHFAIKPWLERTFHSPYSRLLRRLLIPADVAVQVRESQLPLRLRSGPLAWLARTAVSAYDLSRWYLRDRLPAWVRGKVRRLRRKAVESS
jgi:hypothetical protein